MSSKNGGKRRKISAEDFTQAFRRIMAWPLEDISHIIVDAQANKPIKIYVEMYGDGREISVQLNDSGIGVVVSEYAKGIGVVSKYATGPVILGTNWDSDWDGGRT